MITKELTWVVVETHETKICLKAHFQACDIVCNLNLVPLSVVGAGTIKIFIIMFMLQTTLNFYSMAEISRKLHQFLVLEKLIKDTLKEYA